MYTKRENYLLYFVLVLLILTAILLPACNNSGSTSSQKLTIAIIPDPDSLDPFITREGPHSSIVYNNIFESLITGTPDGKRAAGLATSWEISPDGKQIAFTLRQGVKFSNGDPVTVKDAEFSFNRGKAKSETYQRNFASVDRFEAVDDYHFIIHFKMPDISFIPNLGFPIEDKKYYDQVGEDEFTKNPIGTGPYKFVTWKTGEYIDLAANENYWSAAPSVKSVRFKIVKEDSTRISMLKAGEADMIMDVPFSMVGEIQKSGFKTIRSEMGNGAQIQFQSQNPNVPWHDLKVRQAIAYATDDDSIVKNVLYGIPYRYATVAPWEMGYDPNLPPYPYDPAKAKQLLAEAGYPNGFETDFYYITGAMVGFKETTEAVVNYLNAVGIKCKVQGIEIVTFLDKIRGQWHNKPDGVFIGITTTPMAHEPYGVSGALQIYKSTMPLSTYNNPDFDTIVNQVYSTMDEAKRSDLIKQALRIKYDDVATIPLWSMVEVYGMKKNIDFTPTRGGPTSTLMMLVSNVKVNKD
jgi:peptide/nickel transport system substrate-binding protein